MKPVQIPDSDLHAYVDGEFSELRHKEIAAWLGDHPEAALRVERYRNQKLDLRRHFDAVLDEPIPDRLRALANPPPAPARSLPRWPLLRFAAGLAIALFGAAFGWLAHDRFPPSEPLARLPSLPHQAMVAHAVFSPEIRRPVEISAEHEDQLVTWLSKRLGTEVRPPRLGSLGYELVGGRLLAGNSGPVAQFMYQGSGGQRLTLYIDTDNATNGDTAFRFDRHEQINVFYWVDGKFGYAISASLPKDELARVAAAVYHQFPKHH